MRPSAIPLALTPADERVISMLAKVRFATALDVAAWVFSRGSLTRARARLAMLSGGADGQPRCWLLRFGVPSTAGPQEKVFTLGVLGRNLVSEELGSSPVPAYFRPFKVPLISYTFLSHALLLTRTVASAVAYGRSQSAFTLTQTRLSYELARIPGLKAVPDAYLRFTKDDKNYPLWLEIDCGTEFQVKWKKSLRQRLAFIRSDGYAQVFHTRSILIAYVVAGPTADAREQRVQTLRRYAAEVLTELGLERWASILRFVSVDRKTLLDTPLWTQALWQRLDSSQSVPLFGS
jgi:hypothetical protein